VARKADKRAAQGSSSPETQIDQFVGKYSTEIAAQLREARSHLRARFPRGFELIFDNYNALVFAISPSEKSSEAFISIAGYPRWITLFFLHGAKLRDPRGLLEGSGKQVRSIRLESSASINKPGVAALIAQAVRPHRSALQAAPILTTIIKSVVAKQRPRRPDRKK
jgi:hypothetical protein